MKFIEIKNTHFKTGILILIFTFFNSQLLFAGNDQDLLWLILKNLPAENAEHAAKINGAVFKLGKPAVITICDLLNASDTEDVVKAQYAISGLTEYAAQVSHKAERKLFTKAVHEVLRTAKSVETKQFLLAQLALIGGDDSVDILGEMLTEKHLSDPALKALSAINTNKAKKVLLKALESDKTNTIKIIKTLGDLHYEPAVYRIQNYLNSQDKSLIVTCVDALSRIGESQAFTMAMEKVPASQKDIFYLQYAQRRADLGDTETCLDICKSIACRECYQDSSCHQQIAALHILATVAGENAIPDLLQAAASPNVQLQIGALKLITNFPDDHVVDALISNLTTVEEKRKALLVAALGKMKNTKALPVIEKMLYDTDETVRREAIQSLVDLDEKKALPMLLSTLQDTISKTEQNVVRVALLGLPLHKNLVELSRALQTPVPENKVLLIEIIGERNFCTLKDTLLLLLQDENLSVRMAVIKSLHNCITKDDIDPLLAYYQGRSIDTEILALQRLLAQTIRSYKLQEDYSLRCIRLMEKVDEASSLRLLELIGRIGGETSLSYIQKQLTVKDSLARETAIQALVNWPDSTAIPLLLELAQREKVIKYRVIALQGYIRLTRSAQFSGQEKLMLYKNAMSLTFRPEEKIQLVSAVAELRTSEALMYLSELLQDTEISFEAGLAILSMTTPRYRQEEVFTGIEVAGIWLKSQLDSSIYQQIIEQQKSQGRSSERQENKRGTEKQKLFTGSLFNGKDLSGWQVIRQNGGETDWAVESGILYTAGKSGNWLSTCNEHENFKLTLEFRLPPGGNSGVFVRASHEGDPAYTGMEIQILDDYAGQYAELKPWQYTGSIYAVQAPTKRVTKKAGVWQEMEIICDGSKVQVVLNDERIIDTDLIDHMDKVGKNPGLKRRRGYIGLQDHSSRVEFRNILLTELR
jgi:HEAT repeat protein